MAICFFDSSGFVKRYVRETGSKWLLNQVRPSANNSIYVARIAGVEVVATLARRRKGNLLLKNAPSACSVGFLCSPERV